MSSVSHFGYISQPQQPQQQPQQPQSMHAYTPNNNMSQENISHSNNNNNNNCNNFHMGLNHEAIDITEEQYLGLGMSLVPSYTQLPINTFRRHSSFQSSPSSSQSGSPLGLESISLDELSYGVMTTPHIPSKEWSRKSNPSVMSTSAPTNQPFAMLQSNVPQAVMVTSAPYMASPLAPSWNIGIASNDSISFASVPQLTSVPAEVDPLLMQSDIVVPSQQVPHFQGAVGSPQPLQYHPRQGQIQRGPRQKKPQLQIMTSEQQQQQQGFAPMTFGYNTPCVFEMPTPVDTHMTRAHPQNHHGYPWGLVSSPVDSCFSSGTSTPAFASPSSSYTHSDMPSCESSRATSPSLYSNHHNPYDSYLSERRLKRLEESSIIRSRKSSTSSTSSLTSQRRMSALRESPMSPTSNNTAMSSSTVTPSSSHQCPKCNQCFAGPAVLVRHIESIHDKLMWNCVGCKSNLSRRDAVTRHINLSPMDSICRSVGTIGQVKTSNGVEVHYEVSSYRAKPLDEVMSRMGKKISSALRKEIDRSKAAAAAAAAAEFGMSTTLSVAPQVHHYRHEEYATHQASVQEMLDSMRLMGQDEELDSLAEGQEDDDVEEEYLAGDDNKRRRSSVASLGRKKK
ncbi:MAG: hypothetical protein BYD32DRAFT_145031 [Podila humilis]|nr:MAG: hypothetical protein BYD32DRAFT_145031 [Podila humilis]